MGTILDHDDFRQGDTLINFNDPIAVKNKERLGLPQYGLEDFARILAYLIFSEHVHIPSRHIIRSPNLYQALKWVPELLTEGYIIPDIQKHLSSLSENARERNLDMETINRAEFIDNNARIFRRFNTTDQSTLYYQRLFEDISPQGALRGLLGNFTDKQYSSIEKKLNHEDNYGSRASFVDVLSQEFPEKIEIIEQWSALRYYTTPMELDKVLLRDLPHFAVTLLRQAKVKVGNIFITDPDYHGDLPEPMSEIQNSLMQYIMPRICNRADAQTLFNAVITTRNEVPMARRKFQNAVQGAQETWGDDINEEINRILKKNLQKESVIHKKHLSDDFIYFFESLVQDAFWEFFSLFLGYFGFPVSFAMKEQERKEEREKLAEESPWKFSSELINHKLHHKSSVNA